MRLRPRTGKVKLGGGSGRASTRALRAACEARSLTTFTMVLLRARSSTKRMRTDEARASTGIKHSVRLDAKEL